MTRNSVPANEDEQKGHEHYGGDAGICQQFALQVQQFSF